MSLRPQKTSLELFWAFLNSFKRIFVLEKRDSLVYLGPPTGVVNSILHLLVAPLLSTDCMPYSLFLLTDLEFPRMKSANCLDRKAFSHLLLSCTFSDKSRTSRPVFLVNITLLPSASKMISCLHCHTTSANDEMHIFRYTSRAIRLLLQKLFRYHLTFPLLSCANILLLQKAHIIGHFISLQ